MTSIFALLASAFTLASGPVTGLSIAPDANRTQVHIAVAGEVDYRDFTMQGPHRLIVDLFGAEHRLPEDEYLGLQRGGIVSVRTSQYTDDVVRIVLELSESVPYEIRRAEGGLRVTLENRAGAFASWTTGTAAPTPEFPTAVPLNASAPEPLAAASPPVQAREPITITFNDTPIRDVLLAFAEHSGFSIISGTGVQGSITAAIDGTAWDEALNSILETNGFIAEELDNGIIEVHNIQNLQQREASEPVVTTPYRINYATAQEIAAAVQAILGPAGGGGAQGGQQGRGTVAVSAATNTVIVTDIERKHDQIRQLIQELDVPTPQVTIQAKIVFVSRTALDEFGITYDLKDSAGNQLNVVAPGATDLDGDGVIELPEEEVPQGTNVVSLGGNSLAALGNANARVASPTLTLLSSLLIGRHTLIGFIEALESYNLSDVQAQPLVRVMDNQQASIRVGEDTPLRIIDASSGAGGGGTLPTATVQIQPTGISLVATPHVTAGDNILLELTAERSAPQLAESDAGFIFNTQNATTRVLVRDGQTVVIGGLTVTEQNEVRSGIPLLMELPLVGGLFRVTRRSNTQRDLIILVTPHIVRDASE